MKTYFVGWDVGSWMCSGDSKDAVHILAFDGAGQAVTCGTPFHDDLHQEHTGGVTLESFFKSAHIDPPSTNDRVVLAVDAVFGLPTAFMALYTSTERCQNNPCAHGATGNTYLYRETERFVKEICWPTQNDKRPMSAVADQIGNHATKARHILLAIKKAISNDFVEPPVDDDLPNYKTWAEAKNVWSKKPVHIIEVYPSASAVQVCFQRIQVPQGTTMASVGKGDRSDALRCAVTGICYAQTLGWNNIPPTFPEVWTPWDQAFTGNRGMLAKEGWIWFPKCLHPDRAKQKGLE